MGTKGDSEDKFNFNTPSSTLNLCRGRLRVLPITIVMKITTASIRKLKGKKTIVAVTAYDALMATLADRAEVDLILVGDSVGNTLLGWPNTVSVTVEVMLHHTAAVCRARPNALVVADIPFPDAHLDAGPLLKVAARFMQEAGAEAVKLEGGVAIAPSVARLTRAGIPVLGHIGLLPQQVHQLGGYRKFGALEAEWKPLIDDALALEAAGAFALVAEMVDPLCARDIAAAVGIPVIGIGSGPHCDGQILVCTDLLGMGVGKVPPFVKQYAEVGTTITKAFAAYAREVREGGFPK